jgi:hypothetical protein
MTYEKQRRGGRKVVALECWVEGVSHRTSMRLSDLGVGGGYVDTPAQVERGDRIHVTFVLDGQELRCPARVAHVQPAIGFGFAFLGDELTDEQRLAIERFVEPDE